VDRPRLLLLPPRERLERVLLGPDEWVLDCVHRVLARTVARSKTEKGGRVTSKTKLLILTALQQYRGDDYERAKREFRGCTPAQMRATWNGNGQTRQEVLDGYRDHAFAIDAAIEEVKSL